ncbi:hypothetical protein HPP92_022846 [Vanilla planifolia]|uniref:Uncharacterized protein n=1 Tax=Vanilla planifolia TaxID=51239 RepID=A0A835UCA6_VANPL|nr:hypothetical protein HPP92_022846 [Vanilla planifolia]
MRKPLLLVFWVPMFFFLPIHTRGDCGCDATDEEGMRFHAIPLKIAAIFSILVAGGVGSCLPFVGKWVPFFRQGRNFFFVIKAMAAGVILATAFVHILPKAFDKLSSPCLNPSPWQDFPFAGFVVMVAAIGTTFLETVSAGYYARAKERNVMQPIKLVADEDKAEEGHGASDAHLHSQAMHGCTHRNESGPAEDEVLFRHRLISQVLELGIIVHSVIIGISLGVSKDPSTVRPLVAALSFHQFFEGMGLGGCLVQAQLKLRSMTTMVLLFSFTTPLGIVVGIGISFGYNENDSFAIIIEGVLSSGAAGILIYIGLVDLLAVDFMNPRVQKDEKLQLMLSISLLIGAGLMSLLAKWA